ncbi:MAG: hypothetical protein V3V20_02975 [Algisphaera sp.]
MSTLTDPIDHTRLITLAERPDEAGAAMLVHVLADANIRAVAVGGLTSGLRAEAPGWVQVKVLEHDAKNALNVLRELKRIEPEDEIIIQDSAGTR